MTDPDHETHENEERTVRCPVEGCDAEKLARGMHLHVRQSSGNGHGPRGEIPDEVSLDDAETVGTETVEMEYPTEREQDDEPRLCPYCSETFAGGQALMIHLGQVADRKDHPDDVADKHDPEDFPLIDDIAEGSAAPLIELEPDEAEAGPYIPAERVYVYIAMLIEEGERRAAQRAQRHLLREPVPSTTKRGLDEARGATHE